MDLKSPSESDPRARPKPFTFYPPKTNRFLIALAKMGIKPAIRRTLGVTEIEIPDDDLTKLRQLRGERCLLTPSHSGGFEPHILMYLAKVLGVEFNFVAAMELFEQSAVYRWLVPRLGVYSIIRGAVDRPSFRMTRQLLAAGERWLVIFPEGETIWQNSNLMPFQHGVTQLAFKAYEDARKSDEEANLYCIPMAIKYVYLHDMHGEIDASLARLESKLSLPHEPESLSRYQRLRRVAEAVVEANERTHQITPNPDYNFNERIQRIKEQVIARLEEELGVTPSPADALLDRIRKLFNAVDRIVYEEPDGSEYAQRLAVERQRSVRSLYDDLWRLSQFVAIYDGYVKESMTFERFLDVLGLLEMEVCNQRQVWGPRMARVKIGAPINLRDCLPAYAEDRRGTVRDVTLTLENSVRSMLDELGSTCPLVDDST